MARKDKPGLLDRARELVRKLTGDAGTQAPKTAAGKAPRRASKMVLPAQSRDPRGLAQPGLSTIWQLSVPDADQACVHARDMAGRRCQAEEAAPLPLPACDQRECRCQYLRIPDQRRGPRRSAEKAEASIEYQKPDQERRQKRGRRRGDAWGGKKRD